MSEEIKEYEKTIQELTEINGKLHQDIRNLKQRTIKEYELIKKQKEFELILAKHKTNMLKLENHPPKNLRDEIAIAAMQGILSTDEAWNEDEECIARLSYKQANAMLKERSKHE